MPNLPVASARACRILPALALSFVCVSSLTAQDGVRDAYLNPRLPLEQRVDDLVARMTLEEKVSQMQNDAPAIARLQIPQYDWWNEALHGVARSGHATVFPQAIGLAATWDTPLMHSVADTISTEARAKYNHAIAEGNRSIFYGLTMWSPNINIDRDPRWGRGQETYGEDPFLTGQMGAAFVEGLQGSGDPYFKVDATAKHYAVHSGPESERHTFDAAISAHDLKDTYLPAFRKLVVDAHAQSVMCAYNAVDGLPACASPMLLDKTLRDAWGFKGYVVSDCAAITDVAVGHRAAPDMAHAAAESLKAGTDLSCGKEYAALVDAVHQGLVSEAEIDRAMKRLFAARMRLGMFDPSESVALSKIPFSENDSAAHGMRALQAARASIVLLKNDGGALPLDSAVHTMAVVGPNAASLAALEGNYNAVASHPVTPLAALQARMPGRVVYAQGATYAEGAAVTVPETLLSVSEDRKDVGLSAEYFDAAGFSGAPKVRRVDRNIDFDWNGAAPSAGVAAQAFSVRWTGFITAPAPGPLQFGFNLAHCSTCGDEESIRVWVDGKLVDDFHHAATKGRRAPTPSFTVAFADTKPHPIRIEYAHNAPVFGAGLTFNWHPPAEVMRAQAVEAARKSDVVVAFLGLSPDLEGEEMPVSIEGFSGGDRTAIELPKAQQELVAALAETGKPVIIVLMSGSAVALQHTADTTKAVLEAWYPGQEGGKAIAETLFGENNPSGRLPITFYAATQQLPAFDDYSMQDRTYRYFRGEPLYPFGYGLSYTRFAYSNGQLSATSLDAGKPLNVSFQIANTGAREGDEVAEAYLIPRSIAGAPQRSLVGFEKVHLARGERKSVTMTVDPRQLSFVSPDGNRSVNPGDYELYVGGSQPTKSSGVFLPFRIVGTAALPQ